MKWLSDFFARIIAKFKGSSPPVAPADPPHPATSPAQVVTPPAAKVPPADSPHAENPSYEKAKTFAGKTEFMKSFSDWLSTFWPKVGLKGMTTIVGTSAAWCMLFVFAMQTETGQKTVASAMAEDSCRIGVAVDFLKDGIPQGAIMRINHNGNCSLGSSGNHTDFADGDCTPEELAKSGALVPGFGGNQDNTVKRSMYCAHGGCEGRNNPNEKVCCVRWPFEVQKPGRILKSKNCAGTSSGSESTR